MEGVTAGVRLRFSLAAAGALAAVLVAWLAAPGLCVTSVLGVSFPRWLAREATGGQALPLFGLTAAGIVWLTRRDWREGPAGPARWAWPALAAGVLLHALAFRIRSPELEYGTLVLWLLAFPALLAGARAGRALALPAAILLLAHPAVVAAAAEGYHGLSLVLLELAMKLLGHPVAVHGEQVRLALQPQLAFRIAEECGGIRTGVAILALSFLTPFLFGLPFLPRGPWLVLLGLALGLAATVVRQSLIYLVAGRWGVAAAMEWHNNFGSGFVPFGAATFVLWAVAMRLARPPAAEATR